MLYILKSSGLWQQQFPSDNKNQVQPKDPPKQSPNSAGL